jgi:uncharacterized protein involved in propanediol utilization
MEHTRMERDDIAAQHTTTRPAAVEAAARCHSGVCHGTLGELLQGPVQAQGDAQIGLISLPIRRYSWMHFLPDDERDPGAMPAEACPGLDGKSRCLRAISLYLQRSGRRLPRGRWRHDSELPEGKGMASSTADVVATLRCLDSIFATRTPPSVVCDILREIERSDSVFLDRYALYLSGRQAVVRRFAYMPQYHACYIDEGGAVDTERSGPALLSYYRSRADAYAANLHRAIDAFERRDAAGIAHCATASALLAQGVLPKRSFDAMLAQRARFGADGIVTAHTGSVIGYLYREAPDPARMGELSAFFLDLGHQCRFVRAGF